jgi:hypothetical protein
MARRRRTSGAAAWQALLVAVGGSLDKQLADMRAAMLAWTAALETCAREQVERVMLRLRASRCYGFGQSPGAVGRSRQLLGESAVRRCRGH